LDGRYRVEQLIGRGAIAEVYRGSDELLARSVAIKVFHPGIADAGGAARERTEMQIQANLQHPNLVALFDAKFGVDPATAPRFGTVRRTGPGAQLTYLVMELVDRGTLADRMAPAGMNTSEVARIGAAAASGLAAVHQFGMVHRDIRPANILISSAGEVKLSDFAFAQELEVERVRAATGRNDGSTAYLSPEQARGGAVGPQADVYALGLVLLESLTGVREYPGPAMESAIARLHRDPVVPDTLPGIWPSLLRAMTQADPARRPTAAQVAAELARPAGQPPAATPAPRPAPPMPTAAHQDAPEAGVGRIVGVTLLVLLVTAGVVVGTVAVIRNNEGNDTPSGTIIVSRTISPTSVVTTTERTTETSREVIAPTVPSLEPPSIPTREPSTPTTPTPPTPPTTTLPAPGNGGDQPTGGGQGTEPTTS
jgi:serine/threonine protein kinase